MSVRNRRMKKQHPIRFCTPPVSRPHWKNIAPSAMAVKSVAMKCVAIKNGCLVAFLRKRARSCCTWTFIGARRFFSEERVLPLALLGVFPLSSSVLASSFPTTAFDDASIASISIVFSLSVNVSETAKSLHTREVVSLDDLMTTSNIKSATCTSRGRGGIYANDSKKPFAEIEGPL